MVNNNKTSYLICAHSGFVYVVMVFLGLFAVAGWLPPVTPSTTGDQLVQLFTEHRMRICVGMTIFALSSMFGWPFSVAI